MGMPPDHLLDIFFDNVLNAKMAGFAEQVGNKQNLKQNVAGFVADGVRVA